MIEKKTFDIFKHELVPQHILLTKEEIEQVLKEYGIKLHQLPHINASDPAARAIGAQPGDVIKIIRKSPTAGVALAYRYVTEG